ncbi:MAG: glycosyltransferase family A protein [Bacteroidota bacterium]
MNLLSIPNWIFKYTLPYQKISEVPDNIFDEINLKLEKLQNGKPLVTILIAAWNEEINILRNIFSISDLETVIPIEIIVVNNNSKDNTQQTLDKLKITTYFQDIQGCGPARQLGMEKAKGKYILLADADCIYPSCWLECLMEVLERPGVVCVYGRYSFLPEKGFPRWKLFLLEKLKDFAAELRQFNRPYLNAFGISMGYIKEYGLKEGYIMHNTRGDDGRLCYDLMKYGKVKPIRSNKARAWTPPRTLQRDGSFFEALTKRLKSELKKLFSLTQPLPPHNTKTSKN